MACQLVKEAKRSQSEHESNHRPNKGEPGSTWTAPNGDWRIYGPDGRPQQDYDHDDHGQPSKHPHDENGGHYHDWNGKDRSDPYVPILEPVIGAFMIVGTSIALTVLVLDDSTIVGIVDDAFIAPLTICFYEGVQKIY